MRDMARREGGREEGREGGRERTYRNPEPEGGILKAEEGREGGA